MDACTNVSTAPRFDPHGQIRLIGVVWDKSARRNWLVVKRKGGTPQCITETDWLALSPTETGVRAGSTRLSIYGIV